MSLIKFEVGDRLILKKKHPCGGFTFTVMRGGSDVRIICDTCKRDLTLGREELEKRIRKVEHRED